MLRNFVCQGFTMKYLPAYSAVVLVIVAGLVHGFWTDRWTVSHAPAEAAARLAKLPLTVGEWEAQPLKGEAKSTEAIAGELNRRYVHRKNGSEVTVVIFAGLPGPVSIHTPDVCYGAAGFKVESPARYRLAAEDGSPGGSFWTADLHKARVTQELHQRIFWAWTARGTWQAADDPRLAFAGERVLFKMYLVRPMHSPSEPIEGDACLQLLRELLPQLAKNLFEPEKPR
jgi:hypothetical protein